MNEVKYCMLCHMFVYTKSPRLPFTSAHQKENVHCKSCIVEMSTKLAEYL